MRGQGSGMFFIHAPLCPAVAHPPYGDGMCLCENSPQRTLRAKEVKEEKKADLRVSLFPDDLFKKEMLGDFVVHEVAHEHYREEGQAKADRDWLIRQLVQNGPKPTVTDAPSAKPATITTPSQEKSVNQNKLNAQIHPVYPGQVRRMDGREFTVLDITLGANYRNEVLVRYQERDRAVLQLCDLESRSTFISGPKTRETHEQERVRVLALLMEKKPDGVTEDSWRRLLLAGYEGTREGVSFRGVDGMRGIAQVFVFGMPFIRSV